MCKCARTCSGCGGVPVSRARVTVSRHRRAAARVIIVLDMEQGSLGAAPALADAGAEFGNDFRLERATMVAAFNTLWTNECAGFARMGSKGLFH